MGRVRGLAAQAVASTLTEIIHDDVPVRPPRGARARGPCRAGRRAAGRNDADHHSAANARAAARARLPAADDVWRSQDGGETWTSIAGGLPLTPTVGALVAVDPSVGTHLYVLVGTELFETSGGAWSPLHSFPEQARVFASDPHDAR